MLKTAESSETGLDLLNQELNENHHLFWEQENKLNKTVPLNEGVNLFYGSLLQQRTDFLGESH